MFQRACRQKQPELRLFLLSASPAPLLAKRGKYVGLSVFAPKPKLFAKGTQTVPDGGMVLQGTVILRLSSTVILGLDPRIHEETGTVPVVRWIAGSKSGNDRYDRWRTFYTVS
jgi:hypothetical protein